MHVKNIHCMIEELADGLKTNVTKSMKPDEVKVLGETVDMLKDLCTAEYYAIISREMEEAKKEDEEEAKYLVKQLKEEYGDEEGERMYRMGYNRSRYSNGRFAPRGRGRSRRMGYMPAEMRMPYMEEEYMMDYLNYPDYMDRMGYGNGNSGSRGGNSGNRGENYGGGESMGQGSRGGNNGGSYGYSDNRMNQGEGSRYGRSYDSYRSNRRHYTEMKDEESKHKMKESIAEIFDDMEEVTMDVIKDLTPEEKTRYKQKLQTMMQKIQ